MKITTYQIQFILFNFYVFILNFERVFFLPDYFLSKVSLALIILISLLRIKKSFFFRKQFKYIIPLITIFFLIVINNYLNKSDFYNEIFHTPFLLNILIFILMTNLFYKRKDLFYKLFNVFFLSTLIVSIFFLIGFGVEYDSGRAAVFRINSNILGIHAVICIVFVLIKFFKKKIGYFDIISLPFFLLLLFGTVSRSAFLILIVSIIYLIFFNGSLKNYRKFYLLFFLILLTPFFLSTIFESFIFERLYLTFVEGDLSARDYVWRRVYDAFGDNFLFGIGQNGYFKLTESFGFAQNGGISPHNVFLEVFFYTGFFGLIFYLYFIVKTIRFSISAKNNSRDILPLFFTLIILTLSLSGQVLEQKLPWILLSYIFVSYKNAKEAQPYQKN